jgi:hypothetical protein
VLLLFIASAAFPLARFPEDVKVTLKLLGLQCAELIAGTPEQA